jgi:hypothetical protein
MLDVARETPASAGWPCWEMLELQRSNCTAALAGMPSSAKWMGVGIRGDARVHRRPSEAAGVAAHFFDDSAAAANSFALIQPGDAILFEAAGVQVERALEKVMA